MFKSQLIKTDVTAVKLINNEILAGIGNFLFFFSQNGNFIKKIRVFDGQKIHGIQIEEKNVLIHGGCYIQTLQYDSNISDVVKLYNQKINDWILATRWLKNNFVALVVMKNKLIICDSNLSVVRQVACKDSCGLYSAFLVYDQSKELVALSGTVFGQILVWKVDQDGNQESSPVLARLTGHNGVIFSVHYNKSAGYICSSSDDRSSILWSVENKCLHTELKQPTPKITLLRKFYGHSSRIFRCLVLDNMLLSAGEDSVVNVWDFDGELLNKIATQQGGPVWAIDSDGNIVVAGGGSCGVLLSHIKCEPICQRLTMPDNEGPRRIGFLRRNIVVVTEKGTLYYYLRAKKEWIKVGEHKDLKSYNILEVSKCRNLVSFSGYHGEIYIYQEQNDRLERLVAFKTEPSIRICSFHWLSCSTFLTCQDHGLLSLWFLCSKELLQVTTFQLPEAKNVWTTSACQGPNSRFIVGDRRGNIYVYELKTTSPIQTLKKAHNHLGITQLQTVGNRIISIGRDGIIKTFVLGHKLELLSNNKTPFSWLVGREDDLLLAFSGNVFVVWDYKSHKTLLEHPCGGGHRSWDFHKEDVIFGYIKERHLYVIKWDKKKIQPVSVVADYHLNVINSISLLEIEERFVVVSGSEDTTLCISRVEKDSFHCIQNVKSHLSSIKAVCVHPLQDKYLVFSGGGRGQLICWLFSVKDSECRQEFSYYEKTNKKLLESEIRIMDLKTFKSEHGLFLLAACSDGNVNLFQVEKRDKYTLHLVRQLFHRAKCVTRLLVLQKLSVLVAMSSDGVFAFWDLRQKNRETPFKTIRVHQSGVVGCRSRFVDKNLLLLLSGGDDGCIVLSLLRFENDTVNVVDSFRDLASHCAQVSGTWISDNYFLTTSIDQKLLVFKWCINAECRLSCTFMGRYNSAVADIQGLECAEDDASLHVFLYGKGVEYVKISRSELNVHSIKTMS